MSMMLADERQRRILGIASTGFPIFPIFGAETGEEDEDKGGNAEGNDGSDSDGGDGQSSGDDAADKLAEMVSKAEYDRIMSRMQAADKAKAAAEKRLQEMDDAEKSELEKAQRDLKAAIERAERAEAEGLRARMEKELLKYPGYTWHDPDAVLTLVDMEMIDFDEESGKVRGVKEALKKLATEKPYLLKGKQQDGNSSSEGGQGGRRVASGHTPNGAQPDDKNKRRKELAKKYRL